MTQFVTVDCATLELVLRTLNRLRYDNDSAMAEEGFHEAAEALRAALANAEPDPLFVKGALTELVNAQIEDMWPTKSVLKDTL